MGARIKHVAIVSHNIDQLQRFYSTLFGMSGSGDRMPGTGAGAAVVTDGYVGMNINGRANGRQGGIDHFGFEVENVKAIEEAAQTTSQANTYGAVAENWIRDIEGNRVDITEHGWPI